MFRDNRSQSHCGDNRKEVNENYTNIVKKEPYI